MGQKPPTLVVESVKCTGIAEGDERTMTISFRRAQSDDWMAVASLLEQHHLPLDGAQDHLGQFVVAVDDDGSLAGVAGIERYGDHGLLRSVAVAERNRGLGTKLVVNVLTEAKQAGLHSISLLTDTAADYFPRFGFRRVARADLPTVLNASQEFQGACPDTAVAMILDLSA